MKYLKPLEFYTTVVKDILTSTSPDCGQLLGFDVRSKYMSLAMSDWSHLLAVPLSVLSWTKQKNQTLMVDTISTSISKYNVVGLIVGSPHVQCPDNVHFSPETKTFMDTLSKTGKFGDLKFTYWDDGIASKNAEFVFDQHIECVLEHLDKERIDWSKPTIEMMLNLQMEDGLKHLQKDVKVRSKTIVNKCYAVRVLQEYLDDAQNNWIAEDDATNKSLAEDEATNK